MQWRHSKSAPIGHLTCSIEMVVAALRRTFPVTRRQFVMNPDVIS
jgi:hypothetical protein